jgi:hypothetical protein
MKMAFEGFLVQDKNTKIWQIRYYRAGDSAHVRSKSTKTTKKGEAAARLGKFLTQLNTGMSADLEKLTVGDLVRSYIEDQKSRGKNDWKKTEQRWLTHLKATFDEVKAITLTTRMMREFSVQRQKEEIVVHSRLKTGEMLDSHTGKYASNSTINRDIATLQGAYTLAKKDGILLMIPAFPKLPEGEREPTGWMKSSYGD